MKGIVGIVGTGDTRPLCICLFYFVCESLLLLGGLLLGCLLVRLSRGSHRTKDLTSSHLIGCGHVGEVCNGPSYVHLSLSFGSLVASFHVEKPRLIGEGKKTPEPRTNLLYQLCDVIGVVN